MKIKKIKNLIAIRMDDGEDFFMNMENVAKHYQIKSGVILTGLGMLKDVELGYLTYPKEVGRYLSHDYSGPFEVTSMMGNLGWFKGQFIVHVHAVLSDTNNTCKGGHLNKATVSATVEVFILTFEQKFERRYDEKTGLKILDF